MNTLILYVSKGTIKKDDGTDFKYCSFTYLEEPVEKDNSYGRLVSKCTCSVDYYDFIIDVIKKGGKAAITFEMVKTGDNSYKRKPVVINEQKLV